MPRGLAEQRGGRNKIWLTDWLREHLDWYFEPHNPPEELKKKYAPEAETLFSNHREPAKIRGLRGRASSHPSRLLEAQSRSARSCCDSAGVPGAWGLGVGRCFGKDSGETTKVEA
eukprot:g18817.t1